MAILELFLEDIFPLNYSYLRNFHFSEKAIIYTYTSELWSMTQFALHYTLAHRALEVPVCAVCTAIQWLFLAVFCPISNSSSLSTALDFLGAHPCFWLSFCITWLQHETQITIFTYSGSKPQRQTPSKVGTSKWLSGLVEGFLKLSSSKSTALWVARQ